MAAVGRHPFLVAAVAAALAGAGSLFVPLPSERFEKTSVQSVRVVDRYGTVLREFLNDASGRGQWRALADIAPSLRQATVAAEDRRFFIHPGVDPLAILRAAAGNLFHHDARSGGSTISQQVVRNVYHHPRTVLFKIVEAWYALRLERMMSKEAILEQYLNRAPYGNQVFGVESAARMYFGKPASDLSIAESAFLAALPNAPAALNPYRNMTGAISRQQMILRRMRRERMIDESEFRRALAQPIVIQTPGSVFRAPHAVGIAMAQVERFPCPSNVVTTIDASLQDRVQWIVRTDLEALRSRHVTNAAVVVLESATGAVRVLVGSADYFDGEHQGQVNGAAALRQPGSALKPFTYALALERGATAADVLADIPLMIPDHQGEYTPENYDGQYHGPVRLRAALACSYNIPAVRTAQALGRDALWNALRSFGLNSITQPAEYYGYGLTLGNAEVTLIDLVNAYATLARGGVWKPLRIVDSILCVDGSSLPGESLVLEPSRRVVDERAAFLVTDILSDPVARRPAFGGAFRFPFPCAVKTGTTKDYRDNWAIGYSPRFTVGVWVGNFDGSAMRGVSGVTGAGPIFHDVMMLLHAGGEQADADWIIPGGMERRTVCVVSGLRPGPSCRKTIGEWFIRGTEPTKMCAVHQRFRVREGDGRIVERIYEVLPPEYREWAEAQRLPVLPPSAERIPEPGSRPDQKSRTLSILSPQDGDLFHVDPVLRPQYQSIRIVPSVPSDIRNMVLRVDSTEQYQADAAGVWWALRRGSHRLVLVGQRGPSVVTSDPVRITVE